MTDTKGNTYTLAAGPTAFGAARLSTYYAKNIVGGGTAITITVNLTGVAVTGLEVLQFEYAGLDTVSPLDQVSAATANGTVMNSGSKTTTQVNELIYGFVGSTTAGITGGGTFTTRSALDTQWAGDKLAPTIGSYSVDGTAATARDWVAHMLTFKGNVQPVTFGGEFSPTAVFFASAQNTTSAAVATSARMGLGASDGTTGGSTATTDTDNLGTSSVQGYEQHGQGVHEGRQQHLVDQRTGRPRQLRRRRFHAELDDERRGRDRDPLLGVRAAPRHLGEPGVADRDALQRARARAVAHRPRNRQPRVQRLPRHRRRPHQGERTR